jgi:hypothetical protein
MLYDRDVSSHTMPALKAITCLRHLNMGDNQIRVAGAIAPALRRLTTLALRKSKVCHGGRAAGALRPRAGCLASRALRHRAMVCAPWRG